jgi:hypothetical protein
LIGPAHRPVAQNGVTLGTSHPILRAPTKLPVTVVTALSTVPTASPSPPVTAATSGPRLYHLTRERRQRSPDSFSPSHHAHRSPFSALQHPPPCSPSSTTVPISPSPSKLGSRFALISSTRSNCSELNLPSPSTATFCHTPTE